MRRLSSVVLCCLAGLLVAAAPSSAAVFSDVRGKAQGCYFATNGGKYVNVGLTADYDDGALAMALEPWPENVFFETTIKLRELYGTTWKRLSPKVARTRERSFPVIHTPVPGNYFYGSRLYPPSAYRKLRELKGTAKVRLKDAETGAVLAETPTVSFSWRKKRDCQLGPPTPQLPLTNGGG